MEFKDFGNQELFLIPKSFNSIFAPLRLDVRMNTGQLQVHRQLPCYDFCLEAGVGKVVTRWLNTVNTFRNLGKL
jgi:hypothetical protein